MTSEHRIIVSLDEIKAVVFRCTRCNAELRMAPDNLESVPRECPKGHAFVSNPPPDFAGHLPLALITSIKRLKEPIYEHLGFKMLLEFDGDSLDD